MRMAEQARLERLYQRVTELEAALGRMEEGVALQGLKRKPGRPRKS